MFNNLRDEIKAIKQLEAEIKSLSDIKKDKENTIKAIMEQAGLETMDIAGYVVRYTKYLMEIWKITGLTVIKMAY